MEKSIPRSWGMPAPPARSAKPRRAFAKKSDWNRAVSNIKVSYLIFPGTAETPGPPDLTRWNQRCKELLDEIGGVGTELHVWKDIVPPWPTPTPSPTVSPTAS